MSDTGRCKTLNRILNFTFAAVAAQCLTVCMCWLTPPPIKTADSNTHNARVSFQMGFREDRIVLVFFLTLSESGISFNFTYGSDKPLGSIGIRFLPWRTARKRKDILYYLESCQWWCVILVPCHRAIKVSSATANMTDSRKWTAVHLRCNSKRSTLGRSNLTTAA